MQHKITTPGKLLDENGKLTTAGYATELVLDYKRSDIKAKWHRIKEWDYYYVGNPHYGVALTVDDNSYMGLESISFLHFDEKWDVTLSDMVWLTRGKFHFPSTSVRGDVEYSGKKCRIKFTNDGNVRHLTAFRRAFKDGQDLEIDLVLNEVPTDSMVIVTPFAGVDTAFYYNQKINCMAASGYAKLGDKVYEFNRENGSMGTLDWGRGVWTYKNTWYWSSLSTYLPNGDKFGFNLGYGFGDTSAATENMLFYRGKAHKLANVDFGLPKDDKGKDDFLSPWHFQDDEGRLDLVFTPILDRYAFVNALVLGSLQHQVFGRFSGRAVLDDGSVVTLDNATGFAEKVFNKW